MIANKLTQYAIILPFFTRSVESNGVSGPYRDLETFSFLLATFKFNE